MPDEHACTSPTSTRSPATPADEATLAALAAVAEPWVDAGATTPERAAALARAGVARNVVGTESLGPGTPDERDSSPATTAPPPVLSVDLRDGQLISPRPELAGREPGRRRAAGASAGGARAAGDRPRPGGQRLRAAAATPWPSWSPALPGVAIYAGGGVRDDADLRALESAGAAGALVATALHEGRITP